MMAKRRFGKVRRLPSGRWQARYPGPDGMDRAAPQTFGSKSDAEVWLTLKEAEIRRGDWLDPEAGKVSFGEYASSWIRDHVLKPRTLELYAGLLKNHLAPTFGNVDPGRLRLIPPRLRVPQAFPCTLAHPPFVGHVAEVAMASRLKRSVPVTVNDVLDGHAALDLECLDRLYLHVISSIPPDRGCDLRFCVMDMSTRSDLALGAEQKTAATRGLAQVTRVTPLRVRRGHPHQITLSTTRLGGPSPTWWTPENRLEIMHGYLGQLQVGGQVIQFLNHRGYPVPSPACLQQIGDAFRRRVSSSAAANHLPVVPLRAADRNTEVMRPYLGRAAETGRSQVAAIGVAQEAQRVFIARKRDTDPSRCPQFSFDKKDRRVTVYYFYLWDASFGPAFIKVCTYCPWPVKIWVNGHEWAKQQARKAGLPFTELSNGFASCQDPALLQRICDALQPGTINVFVQRWLHRLPLPLGPADQQAGYWWECSMAQVEVSRTIVFTQPRYARAFFDALVTDNLDLGRPDTVEIIFDRQVRSSTEGEFRTNVITRGTEVTINAFYKHSRIKQYLNYLEPVFGRPPRR